MTQKLEIAIQAAIKGGLAILDIYQSADFGITQKEDDSPLTKADIAAHNAIIEVLSASQLPILSEESKAIDYSERQKWDIFWMVDPLDGTKEFIKRNGEFTVNIALIEHQKPILGVIYVPVTDVLYFADKTNGSFKIEHATSLTLSNLLKLAARLPISKTDTYSVVGSRSHQNEATQLYFENIVKEKGPIAIKSIGSSLKFCLIAEGLADAYPRLGPTMEWDTAAGHAIAQFSGAKVVQIESDLPLVYNKPNLLNPFFKVTR